MMQHGGIADPVRIEGARAGSAADVDALLGEIWPAAFRVAYSILRGSAAAEDAAQEACAVVVARIGRLRSTAAFATWFYRIVVREALRVGRRQRPCEPLDDVVLGSEGALYDAIARLDVAQALRALTPMQRTAVTLRYYADLNSREIGEVLGIPEGTVRSHLSAARARLGRMLDPQLGERGVTVHAF